MSLSQEQVNRAVKICDQVQEGIALIQQQFEEMKAASLEFEKRMAQTETEHTAVG